MQCLAFVNLQDRYRDTGSMIEKAAKQPAQPCRPEGEEHSVTRYQAMRAAAAAALNRQGHCALLYSDPVSPKPSADAPCLIG